MNVQSRKPDTPNNKAAAADAGLSPEEVSALIRARQTPANENRGKWGFRAMGKSAVLRVSGSKGRLASCGDGVQEPCEEIINGRPRCVALADELVIGFRCYMSADTSWMNSAGLTM